MTTSCTTLASAIAGDVDDVREIALTGGDLDDDDLVGATVVGHVWPAGGGATSNLAGAVVSAKRKVISINLGGPAGWLPTLTVPYPDGADFELRYHVTFADGRQWTWPSGAQPDRLHVDPAGGS